MSHSKVSFKVGITIISHRNVVCLKKGIWAYAADKEILEYITNEHEAEVDVSLEFPDFFYDPMDVSNLISGSSAFLNPFCAFGSSWLMYYWSLAWRILSITLLASEMSVIVW